jgi:hypothetical protein
MTPGEGEEAEMGDQIGPVVILRPHYPVAGAQPDRLPGFIFRFQQRPPPQGTFERHDVGRIRHKLGVTDRRNGAVLID